MRSRQIDPKLLALFTQLEPLLAQIVRSHGLKWLGVYGNHNINRLPREFLVTATVVEEGSIFDRCLRNSPLPFKLNCFTLAVQKAKSMGFHFLALRLPTKWERFKLWGWKKLPTLDDIRKKRQDTNPIPVTMRPPTPRVPNIPVQPRVVVPYGQRLPGNKGS